MRSPKAAPPDAQTAASISRPSWVDSSCLPSKIDKPNLIPTSAEATEFSDTRQPDQGLPLLKKTNVRPISPRRTSVQTHCGFLQSLKSLFHVIGFRISPKRPQSLSLARQCRRQHGAILSVGLLHQHDQLPIASLGLFRLIQPVVKPANQPF